MKVKSRVASLHFKLIKPDSLTFCTTYRTTCSVSVLLGDVVKGNSEEAVVKVRFRSRSKVTGARDNGDDALPVSIVIEEYKNGHSVEFIVDFLLLPLDG